MTPTTQAGATSADETKTAETVERPYAFCCNMDPASCDCANPNHGTAMFEVRASPAALASRSPSPAVVPESVRRDQVEALARSIAAEKIGSADPTGARLPEDIWRQALPEAERQLADAPPSGRAAEGGDDDTHRCGICDKPLIEGQMVMTDVELGEVHATCCGPERDSYVKNIETGEPLGPNDPIPAGRPYVAPTPPASAGDGFTAAELNEIRAAILALGEGAIRTQKITDHEAASEIQRHCVKRIERALAARLAAPSRRLPGFAVGKAAHHAGGLDLAAQVLQAKGKSATAKSCEDAAAYLRALIEQGYAQAPAAPEPAAGGETYSAALSAMKLGASCQRRAWRPGKSVRIITPQPPALSYLALVYEDGRLAPWTPTRCDQLEDDWLVTQSEQAARIALTRAEAEGRRA